MPQATLRTVSVKWLKKTNQHWKKWRVHVMYDPMGIADKGMLNVIKILHESEQFLISDVETMNRHRDVALAVADAWNANPQYTERERVLINAWAITGDPKQALRIRKAYDKEMGNAGQ